MKLYVCKAVKALDRSSSHGHGSVIRVIC